MTTNLPKFDLVAQVERDLGPGRVYGRWVVYPCPFHNDRHPSLAVTNGDDKRGPYWRCFAASCGKHGGPLSWLMEHGKLTKEDALKILNGVGSPAFPSTSPFSVYPDIPPGPMWQARAEAVIERAQAALWGEPGQTPLAWVERDPLTGKSITHQMTPLEWLARRGLTHDTLRLWKIGYIPQNWQDAPKQWGLTGKPIWLAQGILIPCMVGGEVWYLKIRRIKGKPKYIHVRKSQPALYMAQTLEFSDVAVFCEGELDALLLWQEVGDLVGVVTLGSADNPLNVVTWGYHLLHVRHCFTAYDADESGSVGGDKLAWMNTHRLNIPKIRPYDKDLTDYHKSGGNLRDWLQSALFVLNGQHTPQSAILSDQVI